MLVNLPVLEPLRRHVQSGGRLWLFLDYDGTLVPIAPTPDEAQPDADLLELLTRLVAVGDFRTVVISGRPLSALQTMLPIPGLRLAGTYGLEIQTGDEVITREATAAGLRSRIDLVKSAWDEAIAGRPGFLLEDKGLALALHARWADPILADIVLTRARLAASPLLPPHGFRILGGDRFLEVAPEAAHKGRTVEWLLTHEPWPGAQIVYFGDDDKDEEAFDTVQQRQGIPIAVGTRHRFTRALGQLPSPEAVRLWLRQLLADRHHARANT
jgi:trehalose 6-phosphate phosphatase